MWKWILSGTSQSIFFFLEMTDGTELFWFLQFLTNTPLQVQKQTRLSTYYWKIEVLPNWSCLFNPFCNEELVDGVWVCCQSFFNYEVQHNWLSCSPLTNINSHLDADFELSSVTSVQDQQDQRMQHHVLNRDKPELWPGRVIPELLLGAFS